MEKIDTDLKFSSNANRYLAPLLNVQSLSISQFEIPAPYPLGQELGLSIVGEFNIFSVLKDAFLARPQIKKFVESRGHQTNKIRIFRPRLG